MTLEKVVEILKKKGFTGCCDFSFEQCARAYLRGDSFKEVWAGIPYKRIQFKADDGLTSGDMMRMATPEETEENRKNSPVHIRTFEEQLNVQSF